MQKSTLNRQNAPYKNSKFYEDSKYGKIIDLRGHLVGQNREFWKFGLKIGEIWLNSSSQNIPDLMGYTYMTV